jgi:hypothetical protein
MHAVMSLHQNNKLLLVHHKRCFVSHWPRASEIDMLLITNFLELRVIAEISRTLAGRNMPSLEADANLHIPCRSHAVPMLPSSCRDPAMALRGLFQKGIFVAWQGNGMVCVNQTRPHCVNQMEKTQSKALAERHGNSMGTAWYVWIGLYALIAWSPTKKVHGTGKIEVPPYSIAVDDSGLWRRRRRVTSKRRGLLTHPTSRNFPEDQNPSWNSLSEGSLVSDCHAQRADRGNSLLTYLLTPWSRVLLEKLTSFRS